MAGKLPPLEDYIRAHENGRVYMVLDETGRFAKFKYTEHTVFAADWDTVTLNARGHVFNLATGECVLRPWSKFFNFQEVYQPAPGGDHFVLTPIGDILNSINGLEPTLTGDFYAMDKLDGALCIAGRLGDNLPMVTSSGAFSSKHAVWCYKWLFNHGVLDWFEKGKTYLFEMIADDDPHPIRYDFEGCVLLGIVDNATGEEASYDCLKDCAVGRTEGVRVASLVVPPGTRSVTEALDYVSKLPASKEGLVLTFDGGFKMKMKGKEFISMQRLFHSLSPKYLMENFDVDTLSFKQEVLELIPEEFTDLKEFAKDTRMQVIDGLSRAYGLAYVMQGQVEAGLLDRRGVYETAQKLLGGIPGIGSKVVAIAMDCFTKMQHGAAEWEDMARGRQALIDQIARNAKEKDKVSEEDDDV